MNESVRLEGGPARLRNSLILTGLTLRTFSAAVSDRFAPAWFVHRAFATRSPLKAAEPEVTLKVALLLAPGATGSAKVFELPVASVTAAVHCRGAERLNASPVTGAPV